MSDRPHFSVEQMCEALRQSRGMVWPASQALGCSDQTIYNYATRHPSIRAVIASQRNRFLDGCELRLIEAAEKEKQPWAITFALATIGRHRGYVRRTEEEISGPGGGPVQHEHRIDLSTYEAYFAGLEDQGTLALSDGHDPDEPLDPPSSNGQTGPLPDGG